MSEPPLVATNADARPEASHRPSWKLVTAGPWLLGLVAIGLMAVCGYRTTVNRPQSLAAQLALDVVWKAVPRWQGLTEAGEFFRLERYLGRHPVTIVICPQETLSSVATVVDRVRAAYDVQGWSGRRWVVVTRALPQHLAGLIPENAPWPTAISVVCDPAGEWVDAIVPGDSKTAAATPPTESADSGSVTEQSAPKPPWLFEIDRAGRGRQRQGQWVVEQRWPGGSRD